MVEEPAFPPEVRIALAHTTLQLLSDRQGIDVLHIKGVAVDPSLKRSARGGTDADVLVRPSHVDRCLDALGREGWRPITTFATDSDLGSAATYRHDLWGIADVHRFFPGMGAEPGAAFERLWRDRMTREIAGIPCVVPSLAAQSVILVLNAARSRGARSDDVAAAWECASDERRREMTALVHDLGAEVAFAAGTGDLARFRGSREYDLWRIESQGGTRIAKWLARVKAAPTNRARIRLVLRLPLVNTDHLAVVLGRPPTRRDVALEFFARPARGIAEAARALVRRTRRDG